MPSIRHANLVLKLAMLLGAFALAASGSGNMPAADGADLASLITRYDWRMVSGNDTSLYKFYSDSTWEESWRGEIKEGRWKQTGGESFSIGAYTFK
ncbi:MAG: hypothetical protein LBM04_07815, partial [Opitutaceae bacterium]|nr:hypothetical protein [Opitutaceae bacterium]